MNIHKLELKNFKSFKGDHKIDFDIYEPGLHFIVGKNEQMERLEGNGVGKSSLFEAVYWTLYGKTLRGGVSASNVTTWGEKETTVSLTASTPALGTYIVRRRRGTGKNSLTITYGQSMEKVLQVEQQEIDNMIGMSSDLFGPAFIRGQFSKMFFEATPTEQLTTMTSILNLGRWADLSKTSSRHAREHEAKIQTLTGELTVEENTLHREREDYQQAKQDNKEWKQNVDLKVSRMRKSMEKKKKSMDKKKGKLKQITKRCEDIQDKLDGMSEQSADIAEALRKVVDRQHNAESNKSTLVRQISIINKDLATMGKLVGTDCPTCKQKVSKDSLTSLERHYEEKKNDLNAGIEEAGKLIAKEEEEYNKRAKKETTLKTKITELEMTLLGEKANEDNIRSKRNEQKIVIELTEAEISTLQEQDNPHTKVLQRHERNIKSGEKSLEFKKGNKIFSEGQEQMSRFWVSGFKDVRLFVIEQTLGALQVEVNNTLSSFGLSDFNIDFACEKENKSGTLSNKFDVLVTSPQSPDPVPWTAWSGGEYQRLRLACELGVSNLILDSRGINASWEVWDEPTAHLSQRGVYDLMAHLQQRARDLKRRVFVIDHVARDFGFDTVTQITKTNSGSQISIIGS